MIMLRESKRDTKSLLFVLSPTYTKVIQYKNPVRF